MPSGSPYRRYTLTAAAAFAAACLAAAGSNLAVDPYGLFGSPRIAGLTAEKPALSERVRYTKGYAAERVPARTLIAGNSRSEMGLDPASPCWSDAERPVFNLGIPGADLADQIRFVEHAAATGQVRSVLLGLDLGDFFVDPQAAPRYADWPGPYSDSPIVLRTRMDGSPDPAYPLRRIKDWLTAAFSLETLADSLVTVLAQHRRDLATRREDGFNPARDYLPIVRAEGQAVLFAQKNAELAARYGRPGLSVYQGSTAWSWTFETLDRFLARSRERGIEAVLVLHPYHGDFLSTIARAGHWPLLEDWKRTLTAIAARHGVALWDFEAFDEAAREPPPPPGDRVTELPWFWEPAHYRAEYGERMLAAILGRDCAQGNPHPHPPIGVRLTPASVEAHLASLRLDLAAYLAERRDRP